MGQRRDRGGRSGRTPGTAVGSGEIREPARAETVEPLAAAALAVHVIPVLAQADDKASGPKAAASAAESKPAANAVTLGTVKVEDQVDHPYKADTISSPKYTEPLVDTPQTITVIKKELIQERVATTLTEALRNTPGITLQQGENGNSTSGDAISMRGFDTQNSIFVDNVRDLGTAVRDTFNIEQIEVVKGPSGADNGRGATAGYINLSSKLPYLEDGAAGTVSYGSEDRRRITGDLNQTLGAASAVRLNVMGQDGGVAGRDVIERRSWGLAPSIGLGLGTSTRFFLFSQHVRQDNTPDGGVPTVGLDGYRFSNSVPNPVQQTLDAAGVDVAAPDSKNYYGFAQDFEDIKANMLTAKFEHDLAPGLTVRNTARYGKSSQERVLTGVNAVTVTDGQQGQAADPAANPPRPQPTPPPNGLTVRDPDAYTTTRTVQATGRVNEIMTDQTNLTGGFKTGIVEHSIGGGVEFIWERQHTPTYAVSGDATPTANLQANLYDPDRSVLRANYAKNGAYTDGETVTTAVYLFDTLHITDRWLVNGSVRWERYETETETLAAPVAPATSGLGTRIEAADNLLSWKGGVLFKPTAISSVYASYANSYQPPGGANFSLSATSTNIANPNLDPQEAQNYELGTKWDLFGGRLAATAALFKSTNKNELARAGDNPDQVIQYGKRQTKGLELALVGEVLPNWNVSGGVTRQKAQITDGTATSDGAGARFTPEWNATLWTTYHLVPYKLTFGGGIQYVDDQKRQENNDPNGAVTATTGQTGYTNVFKVDSYSIVDAMVAYDATPNVSLQLNGYNLFDQDYVAAINNGGSRYIPGVARSYLVSVNVRF